MKKKFRSPSRRFNTASGTDCMQSSWLLGRFASKQTFQYRKRYGLHAIEGRDVHENHEKVSIPQAVRIACNKTEDFIFSFPEAFQYRKRYGLHAIRDKCDIKFNLCGCFNTASGTDCMQ